MLTSKIADPGVVINEMSAFPEDVTPVASAIPSFLDSTENAPVTNAPVLVTPLTEPASTLAAPPHGVSTVPSEGVEQRNFSPPSE